MSVSEIKHFHLYCGLGGGAAGFNAGQARVGSLEAKFRCLGGIDNNAAAMRDFETLAGVPGTVLDLFDRHQYAAFHGQEPPAGWTEATTADIHRAAGWERPDIVFLSAPCKGFSGLLSQERSTTDKYQALNGLTLRGVWLMLEAWKDDPPELVLFENVPRIASRGRPLLDKISALLRQYGYAVAETTHDCGELGGLAQSRRRFLMVARHEEKVPPFLYEPPIRPLRGVGEVLERLPLPGDEVAGPMHRVPALQWKTWVRLALVEAGQDWRSLNDLAVENGVLRDYGIAPDTDWHAGVLGVNDWSQPASAVSGRGGPTNGRYSVADPRPTGWGKYRQLGIHRWTDTAATITSQRSPGQGPFSVADPRANGSFQGAGKYRITPWNQPAYSVISGSTTGQGAFAVSDPRFEWHHAASRNKFRVIPWSEPAGTVIGARGPADGAASIADPRLPEPTDRGAFVIQALDGTWHRPFTTLELAALQGLTDGSEYLKLDGNSDSDWRERIGNAVPAPAAEAIASVMGEVILLARAGETFALGSTPIWVRDLARAVSVDQSVREGTA